MATKKTTAKAKTKKKVTKKKAPATKSKKAEKQFTGTPIEGDLILRTEGIIKRYGKRTVVKGNSFDIRQGEVVGLLGPNGAGKTTSFYMVVGLVQPTEGKIFLGDADITDLPMYKRARKGIGYLAQEPSIFRKLSVRKNIEAILEIRGFKKDDIKRRTDQLLEQLDLNHVENQLGLTLSGGERRRAEIARTLAGDPKFVLLDEPFAGVDPIAVSEIQKIIAHLKQMNLGILITDHNVRETLQITDRAYIMFQGEILIEGTAPELINDPKAKEIYLGENFQM